MMSPRLPSLRSLSSSTVAALTLVLTYTTTTFVDALRYDPQEVEYNLNQNRSATNPIHYWGQRDENHTYAKSPDNWRFPFYTLFLDRFANGDPANDDANNTLYESDMMSNQLRHGGDLQGLVDSLDYIQGMGIKGIYIAGSPFINQPWGADSYSPLDLTLLDKHYGTIKEWQNAMDEIHKRNMWVVIDNTMATMGDLIGFEGYLNTSAPFTIDEHETLWKTNRRYLDFDIGNKYNATCEYPPFWYENGYLVNSTVTSELKGCYNSDFDQYGDIEAFGVYPDWQRQLAKFASVQDRLREWVPSVRERLETFSCMAIATLDVDGFRVDKAMQVTVDAQADFSTAMRKCARKYGKENFMVVGEITAGNDIGSIWIGRGRKPNQRPEITTALSLKANDSSSDQYAVREFGHSALDAGAFHYSVYRFLTRFLGLSGNLEAGYDLPTDWVEMWNTMMMSNDFYNANTGEFDPRHLYGVTNQDVFRWPGIEHGIERFLLGYFITTLTLPGAPLVWYGEEQGLYVVDSTATNYVFGRQAFTATQAWKVHGCYKGENSVYTYWPITKGREGCNDETQAYDHRDPSAPLRNIMRHMFRLREAFPVLERGWLLEKLSNQTDWVTLPGSPVATEMGIYSVHRGMFASVQTEKEQSVWLVYHNYNTTKTYTFNCDNKDKAFVSPFDAGTAVVDLFNKGNTATLGKSAVSNNDRTGTGKTAGCIDSITLTPFEFRAYVPSGDFLAPAPMITRFDPGHDYPIDSTSKQGRLEVSIYFNVAMDCNDVSSSITVLSYVDSTGAKSSVKVGTATCGAVTDDRAQNYTGYIPSAWKWTAQLSNLPDGIHKLTVQNATSAAGVNTNSVDHFLIRFGQPNNPVVWPTMANYSRSLLTVDESGKMFVNHAAPGATQWRYSTNFGGKPNTDWSPWQQYTGGQSRITKQVWKGTDMQKWENEHVIVQYWSEALQSSAFIQHGDSPKQAYARQFPHIFLHGPFNQWGYDIGLLTSMDLVADNTWQSHFMYEWPANFQLNIWGINPDNQPDQSFIYGDVDGDGVIDRLPPSSLQDNVVNITEPPAWPALSYKLVFDDNRFSFVKHPQGNVWIQILLFILLAIMPIALAGLATWVYTRSFYQVKINKSGFRRVKTLLPLQITGISNFNFGRKRAASKLEMSEVPTATPANALTPGTAMLPLGGGAKTVLIATFEYNIDDWNIAIKIGGLGVMAKLMSTALPHMNVVWVVPCVGGIDYPVENEAEPMYINVMGQQFEIQVYYHTSKNMTYVLLDAPIFRAQTKANPYHSRMDDIESAILYAAWNRCIAETIRRFPIDIYHINDYHGAIAPLYLLPQTIPVCLSLHNAEFQGMWPMRTTKEAEEVCSVFDLPPNVVKDYVQYGSVFNLLHAAASYLRIHQRGFGAVGVSKKYGDRSLARYPIFWSLKTIGQLPNPDPTDTAEWKPEKDVSSSKKEGVTIDEEAERKRGDLRKQAQEWAGLHVDPNAELFVFVGRWSLQKGVDLIADIFPSILEKYPTTQLIAIGPVIDLYGKFAALKLDKLMQKYPGRVFSKPEFTQIPPYVFSGAEFALIPSRDEPFGLVAVEFGRKGALGVGARVGGLGQMPGFWYTVESMTPAHLLEQFRQAIASALSCKQQKRALMRAWSAKQRFPVGQWVQQIDQLYAESIRIHTKEGSKKKSKNHLQVLTPSSRPPSRARTPEPPMLPRSPSAESHLEITVPSNAAGGSPAMGSPRGLATPKFPWTTLESPRNSVASSINGYPMPSRHASMISVDSFAMRQQRDSSVPPSPGGTDLEAPRPSFYQMGNGRNSSQLSLDEVVGDRHDLKLQKVDLFFTDSNGEFYAEFEEMLDGLTAKNSSTELCIETFLKRSEKDWFARYRDAKLGVSRDASKTRSITGSRPVSRDGRKNGGGRDDSVASRGRTRHRSLAPSDLAHEVESGTPIGQDDEFLLGDGYVAPKGLRKILSIRIGDWPIYSFFLAFGQVISVNSYQIVLLTGDTTQTAVRLYVVGCTYLVTSIMWWFLVRNMKSVYALSAPWAFFGLAFSMLGIAPFISDWYPRGIFQTVATAVYAAGASSGALNFALNFGDEGGAPTRQWITRALAVTGVAQVYSLALWYWGSLNTNTQTTMTGFLGNSPIPVVLVICIPVAIMLWGIGIVLFLGLPDYYRQSPESIPGLYISLVHRKLVPWFFVMIIIQNYWLSAPYGRNWQFLFGSQYIPGWGVFLLALGFFVGLWAAILYGFSFFSESHTWLLPIFAIGLGAPRWAQMLWGTSSIGWYLPWAGGGVGSAILSRCLWLWLGLLDAVQGVGLGMMLLATLTRQHVMAVLIGAQIVGSAFTMIGRATSPNALYAQSTFPDFSAGVSTGLSNEWFWICLMFQLIIPIGFFKFFRKEQVAKP